MPGTRIRKQDRRRGAFWRHPAVALSICSSLAFLFLAGTARGEEELDRVCAGGSCTEENDEGTPVAKMVGGSVMECAETASVVLEYETWHVDPAEEGWSVRMSLYHPSSAKPHAPATHNCGNDGPGRANATATAVEAEQEEGGFEKGQQQVLVDKGVVPIGSVVMNRLQQGEYLVEVTLLREGPRASDGAVTIEEVASRSTLLRMMPGTGDCLRLSLASEYCDHEAVLDLVHALQLPPTDSPETPSTLDNRYNMVTFQTLKTYMASLGAILEELHARTVARAKPLFFVQIGANDGKFADPLFDHVVSKGWGGLLVEPLPDVFQLLQQNYQPYTERNGLKFENAAIGLEGGGKLMPIKRVPLSVVAEMEEACKEDPDPGMCRYAIGVGTLKDDDKSHYILKEKGVVEMVRCLTLPELLAAHDVSHIDLFQVDAEGYDGEIVLQLDLATYSPMLVQIECDHLAPPLLRAVIDSLSAAGYRLRSYGGDLLAIKPDLDHL